MNVESVKLSAIFQEALKASQSLVVVEPAGEKHGSWVWMAHSEKGKLHKGVNRFVTLAVTPIASSYEVEIWAGADNDARFVRRLVGALGVRNENSQQAPVVDRMKRYLNQAVVQAESLQASDLTETCLPSVPP